MSAQAVKTTQSVARADAETKLLDAAERLQVEIGYSAITTRNVAAEAGVNHGLVHYYFGSMEELFVQVLERFTDRLIERQREMYESDQPFVEKWRTAMDYLDADFESGYQKVWLELLALSWNRPDLRDRVARVNAEWRRVLTPVFKRVLDDYAIDEGRYPADAVVTLVVTFNLGMIVERHSGVTEGHTALLQMIDELLEELERKANR